MKAREYVNSDDQRINYWIKLGTLRIAQEVQHHKFSMFQNGPATMELGTLRKEIEDLRRFALEDRTDTFTKRSDTHGLRTSSPYHDFNVSDLDKP
jgi:hypothetical protein